MKMDPALQELFKNVMGLRLRKEPDSSTSSCGDDNDEEDAEEFHHDVDYMLFKLNVQDEKESPWCQSFSNKEVNLTF